MSNFVLPERVRPFVNHERLMATVTESVLAGGPGNRTVVLAGEPGIGKTAFGIELAHRMRQYYADGELYLAFGGTEQPDHPDDVLGLALRGLGESADDIPTRRGAREARYRALTRNRSMVVFLDGVVTEQQVRALLPGEGSSLVVVTEARPAAPVDATGMELFVVERMDEIAARQLLESIADSARCAAEPDAVTALIALCDRLPQALRIVATMVCRAASHRIDRPLADTVDRLRDETRRRTALSLERVYGAAYRSLPEPTRRCYRALGLRAHGGSVSAVSLAAVLDLPEPVVAELLIELTDMYLVEPQSDRRYRVRELVRRHAAEVDDRAAPDRLADEYRLVEFYDRQILAADTLIAPARPWRGLLLGESGAASAQFDSADRARAWLWRERNAILAAAEFLEDHGDQHFPQRWAVLLWAFYEKEKILDDLRVLHRWGLAAAARAGRPDVVSLLHTQLGFGHVWAGDLELAAAEFAAGAQEVPRPDLEASAVEGLGLVRLEQGRVTEARDLLRRNAELAEQIADRRRILLATFHLAKAESPQAALALLDIAGPGFAAEPADEADNEAKVKYWRGRKLAELGELDAAATELELALSMMVARGRGFDQAEIAVALAGIALRRGESVPARAHLERAVAAYDRLGLTSSAQRARVLLDEASGQ
ncbi:hypothetical protein ACWZHB_04245 [Nocardia sp. FBN12]|uniref:hypothetical protein n=1 Tax=Nocardia sp. FBN12 TaxID=3419766 RepID=UPI003D05F004